MSKRYPLAIPDDTPMPTTQFICPAGMIEDEERRNTKRSGIEQLRHDLDLGPQDSLPAKRADLMGEKE